MADVQAVIDAGVARSASADPSRLTVDAPELVRVVAKALARLYLFAARRRATVFGTKATVAYSAGVTGWSFPSDALVVLRVEITSTGAEVAVTRLDDKAGMAPMPAVYELGRVLLSGGNATDPTTENLTVYYAAAAPALTGTADPLPAAWPDLFQPLLELAVAEYLARKEKRYDEVATFQAEAAEWQAYFDAWLTDASIAPGDRFAGLRPAQVAAASDDGE